jgi:hypothetical protein
VLRLRREEAYFYGIDGGWQMGVRKLEQEGRELLVELVAAAPSVSTAYADAEEPLKEAEQALTDLVSAIVDVELDELASVLWEKERDDTIEQLRRMKAGEADSASCTICGITFLEDPDRLRQHFERYHTLPPPPELLLRPVGEQMDAVETAGIAFRQAYDQTISCLSSCSEDTPAADPERSRGGRPPNPWRDILRAMARKRIRSGHTAHSQPKEAVWLLDWARSLDLPLDPGQNAPSVKTVTSIVAQERSLAVPKPVAKPS